MKNISETENNQGDCLIIGVGSGLEMLLLRNKFRNIYAYDISISDFCKSEFRDSNLFEKKYDSGCEKKYDAIYAIELLEHLENPYEILSDFSQSLKKNGRLIVTTIKNVPQFDHLFNFSDENEFETKVKNLGFNVLYKQVIKHNYYLYRLDANNCFYVMNGNKDID